MFAFFDLISLPHSGGAVTVPRNTPAARVHPVIVDLLEHLAQVRRYPSSHPPSPLSKEARNLKTFLVFHTTSERPSKFTVLSSSISLRMFSAVCSANTFQPSSGSESCRSCPHKATSTEGSTSCTCSEGYIHVYTDKTSECLEAQMPSPSITLKGQ